MGSATSCSLAVIAVGGWKIFDIIAIAIINSWEGAIALDGHIIMFEHGCGSLKVLLIQSISDSRGQFIKQKSHNVDKGRLLKWLICLRFVF